MKTYEQMAQSVFDKRDDCLKKKQKNFRRGMLATAFALVLTLSVGGILQGVIFNGQSQYRQPRELDFSLQDLAIVWPWDDLEIYEKYFTLSFEGIEYTKKGGALSEQYIGEKLGNAVCKGYDEIKDEWHELNCEIFAVKKLNRYLAVKYEGLDGLYLFMRDDYSPPETLGQFITEYNLAEYLNLEYFYYTNDGKNKGYYQCNQDIWQALEKYSAAPFTENYVHYGDGRDVSFSATSEVLGVNNYSFTVTADGYIVTNIASYGYTFDIGADAAKEIIELSLENSLKTQAPTRKHLVGNITEIGEDYIKIDDSIMMKNPDDGIVFTVYANVPEIKRYLKHDMLKVGQTVLVYYDNADENAVISDAINIETGVQIVDGDEVIIET